MNKKQLCLSVYAAMAFVFSIFVFLICFAAVDVLHIGFADKGCSVDINKDFAFEHPLVLNLDENEFILPNVRNGIKFTSGQKIRLACPGKSNHLSIAGNNIQEVVAECVSDKTFSIKGLGNKLFKELRCVDYPEHSTRVTENKCAGTHTEIEIGFEVSSGFVPIITTCFDKIQKDSLYSVYTLSSRIRDQQLSVPRPKGFEEDVYYNDINPRPNTLYTRRSQRTGFSKILNSAELAAKYISQTNDFFLSKGHLTAKADFIYGAQQLATFYYINVAPQWQTFNGNNWNDLEIGCRNFAKNKQKDLIVYTGIHGTATLPDVNNVQQKLSLFYNKNKSALRVPELFWKILYDPTTKSGIAFVGHNNPYDNDVAKKTVCTDLCDKINWLNWSPKNITAGFSYCCDVNELRRNVDYIPDIPVHNLLT